MHVVPAFAQPALEEGQLVRVVFEDGDPAALSGKPVTMEILMSDADVYSFKFGRGGVKR